MRIDFEKSDKEDLRNYTLSFQGTGATPEGDLVCLGPPGKSIRGNRYAFVFLAMNGNNLSKASFLNPNAPPGFDFVVGVFKGGTSDPCRITPDATEFSAPMPGPHEAIGFTDLKQNSNQELGYRFTVWVTHGDGFVVPVPCDPRIINK
ncbi:MAG: hypothetical protein ACOH1R_03840 [Luteimonas sp.]